MLIKLFGAAMVIASGLLASRAIVSLEMEKNDQLDSFIALIRYIRNRIDCYSIPIDKILAECPEEIFEQIGGKESDMTFGQLLERKRLLLDGEARRILGEFSETLGRNYRERQIKLCDGAISSLELLRESEKKKYIAKKKTVNALCIAAAGLVVILLL